MMNNIFSSLVSITKGLQRDNRPEKEFQLLLSNLKTITVADNAFYKINFKRPLNSKKDYYQKLIFNETERIIESFMDSFPLNSTTAENEYNYLVLFNRFDKYLNDIAIYIKKKGISEDLTNDDNYIINNLKVAALRLYFELQEQYGKYSNKPSYTLKELAEKYFNDTAFDDAQIIKIGDSNKVTAKQKSKLKMKPKYSFGYLKEDASWLQKILDKLQLSIDLLDVNTDVKDLHRLLISKDFRTLDKKIYLDCKTTDFKYVVNHLKKSFKNLTPAFIESTGLFYTKSGLPLTAQNLYTKNSAPLKKEIIDNIFKQIQ